MARAWREVAHATIHDEADVEGWAVLEDVTARLIRALIAGCAAVPALNASFDAAATRLHNNIDIDLGIAIDSPTGCSSRCCATCARRCRRPPSRRIDAATNDVRGRRHRPRRIARRNHHALEFRPIGGRTPRSILVPPQVAIVGAGRVVERASRPSTASRRASHAALSLSFDHRVSPVARRRAFFVACVADLATP